MSEKQNTYPAYVLNERGEIEFKSAVVPLFRHKEALGSHTKQGIPVSSNVDGRIAQAPLERKLFKDAEETKTTLNPEADYIKGICRFCGKKFEPKGKTRYCSIECRTKAATLKRKNQKRCIVCDKGHYKRTPWCSEKCHIKYIVLRKYEEKHLTPDIDPKEQAKKRYLGR